MFFDVADTAIGRTQESRLPHGDALWADTMPSKGTLGTSVVLAGLVAAEVPL